VLVLAIFANFGTELLNALASPVVSVSQRVNEIDLAVSSTDSLCLAFVLSSPRQVEKRHLLHFGEVHNLQDACLNLPLLSWWPFSKLFSWSLKLPSRLACEHIQLLDVYEMRRTGGLLARRYGGGWAPDLGE
jgi:hypothetical protein